LSIILVILRFQALNLDFLVDIFWNLVNTSSIHDFVERFRIGHEDGIQGVHVFVLVSDAIEVVKDFRGVVEVSLSSVTWVS
tara:strand:- start:1759 stop:2001 length:243 start_codon:yes stop_codon:yes gene_type:complete